MPRSKEEMKIAREKLAERRAMQHSRERLDEEDWTHLMCSHPLLLGLISDLPVEQALSDLSFAESIGPIINPTLAKEYIYSRKGDELKDILNALIRVKTIALDQIEASLDAEAAA